MKQLEILQLALLGIIREVERLTPPENEAEATEIARLEDMMAEVNRLVYMEKQRK